VVAYLLDAQRDTAVPASGSRSIARSMLTINHSEAQITPAPEAI
jgi:hypothetical protein